MVNMEKIADKTHYKNIYKNTYWGSFEYLPNIENIGNQNIINNRNDFINTYNIKNCKNNNPQKVAMYDFYLRNSYRSSGRRIDHLEIYILNNGDYLILNSPYCVNEAEKILFENDGWTKIYNLYAENAMSFIKIMSINMIENKVLFGHQ